MTRMTEVHHGLEGVIAFESEIAEPDKEGSSLRYRGVDIDDLVGRVPFEKVWGLLVDGTYEPGLPAAAPSPIPVHPGDIRADVQSAIALWTSARMSPECTGMGNGSAAGKPGSYVPSTRRPHTFSKGTRPTRSSISTPR